MEVLIAENRNGSPGLILRKEQTIKNIYYKYLDAMSAGRFVTLLESNIRK